MNGINIKQRLMISSVTTILPMLAGLQRGISLCDMLREEENYCLEAQRGNDIICLLPQLVSMSNVEKLYIELDKHFASFAERIEGFYVVPSVHYTCEELLSAGDLDNCSISTAPQGEKAIYIKLK